jgi:hypothetical protein
MPNTANTSDSESLTPPNNNTHTTSDDETPATPAVTLSLDDQKRAAGLKAMSDPAFRRCQDILSLMKIHRGGEAEFRYQVGVVYADLLDNHAEYGRRDAQLFAGAMERHRTTLDDWAGVARTWTPERFKDLMELRYQQKDMPLSFSHLIEISGVTDPGERDRWVELTLQHGWPSKRLGRKIKNGPDPLPVILEPPVEPDVDDDDMVDDTDPVATPTTIRLAIVRMRGDLQTIPDKLTEWHERVFVPLGDAPGQFGEATMTELEQTLDACDEGIRAYEEVRQQIDEAILQARQAEKPSGNTEAEEGGDSNV